MLKLVLANGTVKCSTLQPTSVDQSNHWTKLPGFSKIAGKTSVNNIIL